MNKGLLMKNKKRKNNKIMILEFLQHNQSHIVLYVS